MGIHIKHKQIAEANRNLYNTSIEASDGTQAFQNIDYAVSYVSKTIDYCIDCVASKERTTVLDIGTGNGHLLTHLVTHVAPENVHAIDIAEKNIEKARRRFPGVNFYVGDFISDFESHIKVDFVTAFSVLHHFYDWRSFFDKADMLLNTGGVIYIDHEPLGGLAAKMYEWFAKVKHRRNPELLLAEYHLFFGQLNPFDIKDYLAAKGYTVQLFFTNIALTAAVLRRIGLNIGSIVKDELLIDKEYKRLLKHGFVFYKIVAKKP